MKKKIRIVLLIIFALLMAISIITLISWSKENKKVAQIVEEEEKYLVIDEEEKEKKEEKVYLNKEIFNDNSDTVGWLKIEGTNINYPVVQHSDNEFYLKHDFKKNNNSAGWIFMDYKNSFDDENIVIYGHHRRDGSMFGDIDLLFKSDFYKKNDNEIILIREKEIIRYRIFSVYKISNTEPYNSLNFESFDETVKELKNKSQITFDVNLEGASQIITLSTCHDNNWDRLVVHGVK